MKHNKVIVVVGVSRGGTNITWNLLQSHPQLVATINELGQELNIVDNNRIRTGLDMLFASPLLLNPVFEPFLTSWLDKHLYQSKMRGFDDVYVRQKSETEKYSYEGMQATNLLLKAGDRDMYLLDLLNKTYPELYIIAVVRNAFAVCESWMRRGHSAEKTGKRYQHYMSRILEMSDKYENFLLLHFEDILSAPFESTEKMFEFAQLEPRSLPKLRLKTKQVINAAGEYKAAYKEMGAKHWFSADVISNILVSDQSNVQESRLSASDKATFMKYAGDVMQRLGYD